MSETRCHKHDWKPLFDGPPAEVDKYFGGFLDTRAASLYVKCASCGAYGLRSCGASGAVRTLSAQEVNDYALERDEQNWQAQIEGWRSGAYNAVFAKREALWLEYFASQPEAVQQETISNCQPKQ